MKNPGPCAATCVPLIPRIRRLLRQAVWKAVRGGHQEVHYHVAIAPPVTVQNRVGAHISPSGRPPDLLLSRPPVRRFYPSNTHADTAATSPLSNKGHGKGVRRPVIHESWSPASTDDPAATRLFITRRAYRVSLVACRRRRQRVKRKGTATAASAAEKAAMVKARTNS